MKEKELAKLFKTIADASHGLVKSTLPQKT